MARLIDADKAKFFIADVLDIFKVPVGDRMANRLLEVIDALPTVEAAPVVHSRWDTEPNERAGTLVAFTHHCPECNYLYKDLHYKGHNYCPNCGAKMDVPNNGA